MHGSTFGKKLPGCGWAISGVHPFDAFSGPSLQRLDPVGWNRRGVFRPGTRCTGCWLRRHSFPTRSAKLAARKFAQNVGPLWWARRAMCQSHRAEEGRSQPTSSTAKGRVYVVMKAGAGGGKAGGARATGGAGRQGEPGRRAARLAETAASCGNRRQIGPGPRRG